MCYQERETAVSAQEEQVNGATFPTETPYFSCEKHMNILTREQVIILPPQKQVAIANSAQLTGHLATVHLPLHREPSL